MQNISYSLILAALVNATGGMGPITYGSTNQDLFSIPCGQSHSTMALGTRLGASIAKFLRENIFPDDYVVIAFQRLYLNFSYQMSILCPKKQISCPLRGNISPKKMTGAQQKITGGLGKIAPLPSPLGGPDERSLPTTTSCV